MLPTSPTQVPSSAGRERARQLTRRVLGSNHAVLCTRDAGYGRSTSPHVLPLPRRHADSLPNVRHYAPLSPPCAISTGALVMTGPSGLRAGVCSVRR